jgi:pyruvate kinase
MEIKSTKVVCTVGPSSHDEKVIAGMLKKGMNLARMNMAHGSYQFHSETVEITRKTSKMLGKHTGILLDLQGPKIRTGKLEKEPVELKKGDKITLTTEEVPGDWKQLSVNYSLLPEEAELGERIFLDDGNIELKVVDVLDKCVVCRIVNGGVIHSFRGVNLPDTKISTPALTAKDLKDLDFGLDMDVDYFALSFVRRPEDIIELKEKISKKGKDTPVVSKIEKPEAIENIDKIIDVSDAVMVARGDLGAETSPQDVPILQKMIIKKCNLAGKPVITATQMLESMISHPRPTRAEASDVANAIFDETDAVMLSGETAVGQYPVESVKVMADIAKITEKEMNRTKPHTVNRDKGSRGISVADSVCFSAFQITEVLKPKLIVSFTMSGRTAFLMSKYRPCVPIIAMSPRKEVLRRLSLFWGVHGLHIGMVRSTEELLSSAEKILIERKMCKENEMVVFIGGVPVLAGAETNMMKVHRVNLSDRNI